MFRVYRALLRLFLLFILQTSQADKRTESLVYQTLGAQEAQERASDGEGHILAVDSDYLLLRQAASLLPVPGIGLGVFAKAAIRANDIICEFRGPVILAEDLHHFPGDKNFGVVGPDDLLYVIIGQNVCAYINDCSTVLAQNYTLEEWQAMDETTYVSQRKCYDGFSDNAFILKASAAPTKIFVAASRDIEAGEEIFFPYLWQYWKPQAQERLNIEVS
mmetsp:Transcript_21351/g.48331  ORF Transcript_21351/g.48331 Transcript_21351/m.48331 type:complete len:218 (+) Transcript_21351:159-812(+)|eukprot:CAMPEP_0173171358 /NCGR_PEP_ID=MMETSP1141-20130122/1720_1 /TAXON_ID=483371 /ORGANISM="non described non described, Strain CCMP2298" /LENGTH=217 /DNA_ID=CAMNT_0014093297 /DNA_START=110 /DNA_END=763 /DNA_ORIENTATION=-